MFTLIVNTEDTDKGKDCFCGSTLVSLVSFVSSQRSAGKPQRQYLATIPKYSPFNTISPISVSIV